MVVQYICSLLFNVSFVLALKVCGRGAEGGRSGSEAGVLFGVVAVVLGGGVGCSCSRALWGGVV